ncbi:cytochrome P450 [Wolfiporia cocos MD-104 SS10]|uniref:Cytochrome P450 n=1 Tax=Wolfiporia cocos (strain MD-104) TaxID=742152 RepID=A0A2H3JRM4_WOLCO|nr:cytochrome P450 [Wolfiporia cocos MD-104 SS10]
MPSLAHFLCLLLALAIVWRLLQSKRNLKPLPPGPKGWPLIGNVFDMPVSHQWKTFTEWGQKWGDITSVTVLGQPVIVLNSAAYMSSLLEKHSSASSDRLSLVVAQNMVGWDRIGVLENHDSQNLKDVRRLMAKHIGTRYTVASHSDLLEQEVSRFVARVGRNPERLIEEVRRNAGAIILNLTYGYHVELDEDPMLKVADEAMQSFSMLTAPGAFIVDFLPLLKYVPAWCPGTQWKAVAKRAKLLADAMFNEPFALTKKQVAEGSALPSMVLKHLQSNPTLEQEMAIKNAAAAMYAGGSDTTVSAVCSFFLAMMCYPEVQEKARQELDFVIGEDRLPRLSDRDKLPYVHAICLEALRWNPVLPSGFPHRLSEDVTFEGYFLPKGSVVIANVWKTLHDPEVHRDPFAFKPERFLADGSGLQPEPDPRNSVFGFGRRICPGMHLAEATIFLVCAMSLAVFDIAKPVEDGSIVDPDIEYTSGTLSHPRPFKCTIKPRSEKANALLQALTNMSITQGTA